MASEKCVADYEIEAYEAHPKHVKELKVNIYSIIIHLTMYVYELDRNKQSERQEQLANYNKKLLYVIITM
jgi:hypothetical protein